MTVEESKKLKGYFSPEFSIDDEVVFVTKQSHNKEFFGEKGLIKKQVPVLADDEHFWFWDYDVYWYNKGYMPACSPWHLELSESSKRDRKIQTII